MLVLCAGTEANAIAAEFWISFSFALASVPAQRTTAHALPPFRGIRSSSSVFARGQKQSGPRKSAAFRVLPRSSISFWTLIGYIGVHLAGGEFCPDRMGELRNRD
jgi:hypothetical protein